MAKKKAKEVDPHFSEDPLDIGVGPNEDDDGDTAPAVRRERSDHDIVAAAFGDARAAVEENLAADIVETRKQRVQRAMVEEATEVADPTTAAVIANLQSEIQQLKRDQRSILKRQEAEDAQGTGGYPFMFYQRPKDGGAASGWIICANGGVGPTSGGRDVGTYSALLGKGFKPLPRYGIVGSPAGYHGRAGSQYVPFFQNGGAKLVPASQVLALKWHVSCPLPGTVFPEYEKVKDSISHFECDEGDCEFDLWFLPEDQRTAGACISHLRGRHEYKMDEARAVLRSQGIAYRTSKVAEAVADARIRERRELLEIAEDDD